VLLPNAHFFGHVFSGQPHSLLVWHTCVNLQAADSSIYQLDLKIVHTALYGGAESMAATSSSLLCSSQICLELVHLRCTYNKSSYYSPPPCSHTQQAPLLPFPFPQSADTNKAQQLLFPRILFSAAAMDCFLQHLASGAHQSALPPGLLFSQSTLTTPQRRDASQACTCFSECRWSPPGCT
jgi:hypothetical protein